MASTSGKKIGLAALAILVLLAIFFGISYNRFVSKQENVNKRWGNLQNDYQRRLDLVPSLVSTVKASADYERETLVKITEQRAAAAKVKVTGDASFEAYKAQEAAQGELAEAANRVIGVIEKYPDIKTTTSFVRLQDQLIGTERRVKFSRKDFNQAVQEYNVAVRSFPSSLAAKLFGFSPKTGFTADAGTDKAPEINFSK